MGSSRRIYTREFKISAVGLLNEGGRGLAQTAKDLGVNRTMLSRWRKEFAEDPQGAFVGSGRMKPEEEERRRLQKEIELLREERDILKKAAEFLAKQRQ